MVTGGTEVAPRNDRLVTQLDALHRQIGIPKGSGLLLRKNEQTAIEGSRRAPRHRMTARKQRCSALPEPAGQCTAASAMKKAAAVRQQQTLQVQRAVATMSAPQRRRGTVGGRARRRARCARSTRSTSEVSLRAGRHACTHDSLTHHTVPSA